MIAPNERQKTRVKPTLILTDITHQAGLLLGPVDDVQPLVEGEESRAVLIHCGNDRLVMRIGNDIDGYQKDAMIARAYPNLPIPQVTRTGWLQTGHAYAISRYVEGITLQDADDVTVSALLPAITDLWTSIGSQRTGSGYGLFDTSGRAPHACWRDVLAADLVLPDRLRMVDTELLREIIDSISTLLPVLPNDHCLIHGDFGSNNLLVAPGQPAIVAIIDWDCAMYGDPLVDIATAFFWAPWLSCMELSARYWQVHLGHMPQFAERIRCHQLWIGLRELIDNDADGDRDAVDWLSQRCRDILRAG